MGPSWKTVSGHQFVSGLISGILLNSALVYIVALSFDRSVLPFFQDASCPGAAVERSREQGVGGGVAVLSGMEMNASQQQQQQQPLPTDSPEALPVKSASHTNVTAGARQQLPRDSSQPSPKLRTGIPGSRLKTPGEVSDLRAVASCWGNNGSWELDPTPRYLPFAPRNDRTFTLCDVAHMKQRKGLMGKYANEFVSKKGDPSQWSVRQSLKYVWQPKQECGDWAPFDRERFCHLMGGISGNLMLVGDSLTGLLQYSLHHHMFMGKFRSAAGKPRRDVPKECSDWSSDEIPVQGMHLCEAFSYCGDLLPTPLKVITIRNDHLQDNAQPYRNGLNYFLPWMDLIGKLNVKVIVLNRGAHYEEDAGFLLGLWTTLHKLRLENPELLVVFRATASGHINCTEYDGPIASPQNASLLPYNWDKFHHQNLMVQEVVESFGGVYMDVEWLTSLRPDGHFGWNSGKYDCLHYCLPGPVDVWVQLFFNLLTKLI